VTFPYTIKMFETNLILFIIKKYERIVSQSNYEGPKLVALLI